jgi:hypothetical protein
MRSLQGQDSIASRRFGSFGKKKARPWKDGLGNFLLSGLSRLV